MTTDEMQKLGKDSMDLMLTSFGAWTKNAQALAAEVADYSRKSYSESAAAWEKFLGAKSLEKAMEVQSDYFKSAYEDFVAQATKLSELYADLAKEAYKPFEASKLGEFYADLAKEAYKPFEGMLPKTSSM